MTTNTIATTTNSYTIAVKSTSINSTITATTVTTTIKVTVTVFTCTLGSSFLSALRKGKNEIKTYMWAELIGLSHSPNICGTLHNRTMSAGEEMCRLYTPLSELMYNPGLLLGVSQC